MRRIAKYFIISVLLISGCQKASSNDSHILNREGKGFLRKVDGNLILYVKGSPYEMGYQRGVLLENKIKDFIRKFRDKDCSIDSILKFYQEAKPYVSDDIKQEVKGIAEGSKILFDEILCANLIDRLYLSCGSLVVFGKSTKDKELYQARTLDWITKKGFEDNWLVIVYIPEDGLRYTVVTAAGLIYAVTGMNEKGLTLDVMLFKTKDSNAAGIPVGFLVHEILRKAEDVSKAIAILEKAKRTVGAIYTISDGNNSAIIEATSEKLEVFHQDRFNEQTSDYAIPIAYAGFRTAIPLSPAIKMVEEENRHPFKLVGYVNIYKKIAKFVRTHYGYLDRDLLIKLTKSIAMKKDNLLNIIYFPKKLDFWVAFSKADLPAYKSRYVHYNLKSLLEFYERDGR